MKKINSLKIGVCLLIGSFMFSSCIGSFSLFNKYANWQKEMTSNKYINAIVGFFLMPIVGSITLIVDSLVLNTIEFWSGENPVASNIGKTQSIIGSDGLLYAVKTLRDGYEVKSPSGEVTYFLYDKKNDSWQVSQNGTVKEIFRFNEDGRSIKVNVDGESRDFTLNQQGVDDARTVAFGDRFYAMH